MKLQYILLGLMTVLANSACTEKRSEPPVEVNQNASDNTTIVNTENNTTSPNSTRPVIVDFPIAIKELGLLIHPIAPIPMDTKAKSKLFSSSDYEPRYDKKMAYSYPEESINQITPFKYTTRVNNLVFEKLPTTKADDNKPESKETNTVKHKLFNHNNFLITDVFYPHQIITRSLVCYEHDKKQQYCENIENYTGKNNYQQDTQLGEVTENDRVVIKKETVKKELFNTFLYKVQETQLTTKQREEIKGNLHLQKSLYMSDENGQNVKKLHDDKQYLTDSKWLPSLKRYYFTTRADSNGNNIIDYSDEQFNYLIDFNQDKPTVTAYKLK